MAWSREDLLNWYRAQLRNARQDAKSQAAYWKRLGEVRSELRCVKASAAAAREEATVVRELLVIARSR